MLQLLSTNPLQTLHYIHEKFIEGECTVNFIEQHPELFKLDRLKDSSTKILKYLADVKVNGHPDVKLVDETKDFRTPIIPSIENVDFPQGSRDMLFTLGRKEFMKQFLADKKIHFTNTTYRDAHK